jgi:hypothetical protein
MTIPDHAARAFADDLAKLRPGTACWPAEHLRPPCPPQGCGYCVRPWMEGHAAVCVWPWAEGHEAVCVRPRGETQQEGDRR